MTKMRSLSRHGRLSLEDVTEADREVLEEEDQEERRAEDEAADEELLEPAEEADNLDLMTLTKKVSTLFVNARFTLTAFPTFALQVHVNHSKVRSSGQRTEIFLGFCAISKLEPKKPPLSVDVRWTSDHEMLQFGYTYREPLRLFILQDPHLAPETYLITEREWERIKKMLPVLLVSASLFSLLWIRNFGNVRRLRLALNHPHRSSSPRPCSSASPRTRTPSSLPQSPRTTTSSTNWTTSFADTSAPRT